MGLPEKVRLLTELPLGESASLRGFTDQRLAARLLSMGVLPGTRIEVLRQTIGGTFYVRFDQTTLALRKNEAACMQVN